MPSDDPTAVDAPPQQVETPGPRFDFGKNWQAFLASIDERRITLAMESLEEMLKLDLGGRSFLDAGCGSGLFSLAARRMGANVTSFDNDPNSVECAKELRQRFAKDDEQWNIARGSVLDENYLESLGQFDIVYSWGVLHHTGRMWQALDNVHRRVKKKGLLYIAIYNDEGLASRLWVKVKRFYCSGPVGQAIVMGVFIPIFAVKAALQCVVQFRNVFADYAHHARGMSMFRDWIDWLGGYPFEVAKPEEVLAFLRVRGFTLENLKTTNRMGCNEYVFRRTE
jgi:2-polyprenyl-6-hydroxyphenyl methylase/3-demethylubiquinone-9 3-methyltransferase